MYSELQIPEEELLREVLPEVERSDITPEELQGLEEAGLDFIRFPQIRSRLADMKRAILRTALMRGNLRHAIRKAAQVGAHKVYHKITQGDSVVFYQGILPSDSSDLKFFSELKVPYNFDKAGIQHDKPLVLTGIAAFVSPSVVGKDTDWTNIVQPMLDSEVTLKVSRDDGEKAIKLPMDVLAGNVQGVSSALDGNSAPANSFYLAFQNARFGQGGFFPIKLHVPARKSITAEVNFRSTFSGNTLYRLYIMVVGKELPG